MGITTITRNIAMANTKPQRPHRYITFDELTFDALTRACDATGLSLSHVVGQLLRAHVQELDEYTAWLKRQKGDTKARGIHALASAGPNDLITELRQLDPAYRGPDVQLLAAGAGVLAGTELADLRTMLAEWKAKQTAKVKK